MRKITPITILAWMNKLFIKKLKLCLVLLLLILPTLNAWAISLPFIDEGLPFDLVLKDVDTPEQYQDLVSMLNDGIKLQRKENLTLKQYTDTSKIMRFELDIIRRILKSQGYYHYFVDGKLLTAETQSSSNQNSIFRSVINTSLGKNDQPKLIYQVNPGTRYKVSDIVFKFPEGVEINADTPLAIKIGDALKAEQVLESVEQIRNLILNNHCFYDISVNYQTYLNHQDSSAQIEFEMSQSEQVEFGPIEILGLESVDEKYLRSFISYKESECFKRGKVDQSRLALLRTNLIANVVIDITNTQNGQVTTSYKITERNHRTLKAGIGYSTDESVYLSAGWEHRNIQGAGEKLDINTRVSSLRQKILGEYYIPNFYSKNKSLTLYSEALNEELDAYEALSLKAGAKIGFKRSKTLSYFMGGELKISDITDEGEKEAFYLLSFPLELEWDHTNDILDPTDGFLITAGIRPYIDVVNNDISFFKSIFSISSYHTFDVALRPTIAARYSLGSITGERVDNIPADERFYVGGGGSVRGYPYQSLSILDQDDPEGGASFQQINTELRIRFLENWGMVTFLGGGFAFEEATPNMNQRLLWGAGLGLRYYTAFAPFRLDVAFPLNKRENYDDDFQLYISIGQAF